MKYQDDKNVIILIPSLQPDLKLLSYVDELKLFGIKDVIIVNDGSGEEYKAIFEELAAKGCVVLHHLKNRGKGCALKTGFNYIKENRNQFACIVMVDSDGQHSIEDVVRISEFSKKNPELLTLGVRDFSTPGIPAKSLLGNRIASFVFAALYGKRISDTQTGLRAFGMPLLDFMSKVKGDRFEYEIKMLISCIQENIPIRMIPIKVIYENSNEGTHFRPVLDSVRVVLTLFSDFSRFLISSFASAIIDIGIAWFLLDFLLPFLQLDYLRILIASVSARAVSTGINYAINKKFVFKEDKEHKKSIIKYLLLCTLIVILSATGVYLLHKGLGVNEKMGKIVCDALLFLLSYRIQQRWVFMKGDNQNVK